jgi:hypothetical protein
MPKRLRLKEQPGSPLAFNLRQLVAQEMFMGRPGGQDPDAILQAHRAGGAQVSPELYPRAGGMRGQLGYEEEPDTIIHIASRKALLQHVLHPYHGTLMVDLQHVLQHVWANLRDVTSARNA